VPLQHPETLKSATVVFKLAEWFLSNSNERSENVFTFRSHDEILRAECAAEAAAVMEAEQGQLQVEEEVVSHEAGGAQVVPGEQVGDANEVCALGTPDCALAKVRRSCLFLLHSRPSLIPILRV
jgi:hypothetical protein